MAERVGEEWGALGHDVDYILAKGAAARVGTITIGVPGIALWWYRTLKEIAANHQQYDLIWTHQPVAPLLPTTDSTFWNKVIATTHTTLHREYELVREGVYPTRLLPYYWLAKTGEAHFHQSLATIDAAGPHYTVVSPHLRDEINQFGIETSTYIPNGVFTPEADSFEPIRSKYGIPETATLVFNIGSLTPQKRPEVCAQHLRAAAETLDDTYVVMAGDGPLREAVSSHASESLRVIGYVSENEKWRWFSDADIFASLSAYEGMPVATAEALSFNLPVVLSDIPSHRHLVETYDAAGSLITDDTAEIAKAIATHRNERSAVSLPSWPAVAEQYLEIIQQR
ncbi:glycosyltransferase family 4 protein [Halorientalis marina]|uniref:glycosyltransferase family 4 protein n=1 Tax=Halorientalis marina TaxID=2931976 RepID=UPI001FF5C75F|nr:glycosyltransferase family 4 protein [Halorientalis marina]